MRPVPVAVTVAVAVPPECALLVVMRGIEQIPLAYDAMKQTIAAMQAAGVRDKVKVMIGGGQIDENIRQYTGADAYGKDAMAAVALAKEWVA